MDDEPVLTVGSLRQLLHDLPDATPFRVHFGTDLTIDGWEVGEDGLVLFPDDSAIAPVNRQWLESLPR